MRLSGISKWWWVQPALLAGCLSTAHAQFTPSVIFTNARVVGPDFYFDASVPLTSDWTLESAPSITGPWTPYPLPMPGGHLFRVPIDIPQRHFRARNSLLVNSIYSVNVASWLRVDLPAGFSLVANPVDNGRGNRLADIWPAAADGTEVYHWDAPAQRWAAVSQFAWGGWSADRVWTPGTATIIRSPAPGQRLVFAGLFSGPTRLRSTLVAGWNLVGLTFASTFSSFPFNEEPTRPLAPADGDTVYLLPSPTAAYSVYTYVSDFGWDPSEPAPSLGQGLWYYRAGGVPGGSPPHQLYFNNYAPASGLILPISVPPGTILEGTKWLAQLYAGDTEPLLPLGWPMPFRKGPAAGYVDAAGGGPVALPEGAAGALTVRWRIWDSSGGASYEAAVAQGAGAGQSAPVTLILAAAASPPAVPQAAPLFWPVYSFPATTAPRLMPDASGTPSFAFWLGGAPDQPVILQRSPDLITWADFRSVSNVLATGWQTDPLLPGTAQQYYRVKPTAP